VIHHSSVTAPPAPADPFRPFLPITLLGRVAWLDGSERVGAGAEVLLGSAVRPPRRCVDPVSVQGVTFPVSTSAREVHTHTHIGISSTLCRSSECAARNISCEHLSAREVHTHTHIGISSMLCRPSECAVRNISCEHLSARGVHTQTYTQTLTHTKIIYVSLCPPNCTQASTTTCNFKFRSTFPTSYLRAGRH